MKLHPLSDKERIAWLRLARSENVGPVSFFNLLSIYGSAQKALDVAPSLSSRGGRKKPITILKESEAVRELEVIAKMGGKIIAACEPEYPALLRETKGFPPLITVLGRAELLNQRSIAIVGARNASANGCRFAQHLAHELGTRQWVVASGLARGIDTAAHRGSLETGTIAVIAGGVDRLYPPENADLFKAICEKGAVIAEMPLGAVPRSQHFPRRNRIISGVSQGTLIVEASQGSGSLITARMALEQNREVFAVPGSPMDPRCNGTNGLIKQGAHLVESAEDIVQALAKPFEIVQGEHGLFDFQADDFAEASPYSGSEHEADGARPLVLEKLSSTPVEVDEIIAQTGFSASVVLTILLELELAGRLERHAGNRVALLFDESSFEAPKKQDVGF